MKRPFGHSSACTLTGMFVSRSRSAFCQVRSKVFLQKQNAVMIHDTDYTPDPKTDAEKAEMRDWVKQIMEKVLGAPLAREVNVLVDPNAGARGYKCYCTSATYVVAFDELTAA